MSYFSLEHIMQTQTNIIPAEQAQQALYAHTVDKLAQIKAQIADLRAQEDELKQLLIDSGLSAVDGTMHRATISEVTGKETTNWMAIAMKFNPSRQMIRAYTTPNEAYFSIRVFGRKTSN
jgi:hypothetical protein